MLSCSGIRKRSLQDTISWDIHSSTERPPFRATLFRINKIIMTQFHTFLHFLVEDKTASHTLCTCRTLPVHHHSPGILRVLSLSSPSASATLYQKWAVKWCNATNGSAISLKPSSPVELLRSTEPGAAARRRNCCPTTIILAETNKRDGEWAVRVLLTRLFVAPPSPRKSWGTRHTFAETQQTV